MNERVHTSIKLYEKYFVPRPHLLMCLNVVLFLGYGMKR